jgi:uncharacterized delta-60 repeat protein
MADLLAVVTPKPALSARSTAGSPDTKNGRSMVLTDFSGAGSGDIAQAMAIQSDGKIVVAGRTSSDGSHTDFALARYTTKRALDPTFGNGGKVTTDVAFDYTRDVAIQSDGKIVVAGHIHRLDPSGANSSNVGLVRYTSTGQLDPTFGVGGVVETDFGSINEQGVALAMQPDGKILVAGQIDTSWTTGTGYDFLLARYTGSGSLDPTFGSGGWLLTNFDGTNSDYAADVLVQPDGKIVAVGWFWDTTSATSSVALARFTQAGALDPGFGIDGKVVRDVWPGRDDAVTRAVLVNGKIVIVGSSCDSAACRFGLARFTSSGALDATFGTGGAATAFDTNPLCGARDVTVQPDGKIVVVGSCGDANDAFDFALARFTSTGALDAAFGRDGQVLTSPTGATGYADEEALGVAIQPDGKIAVTGFIDTNEGDFALLWYNSR